MIDAIINEAKPLNLLRRYQSLAKVGKQIVRTDIPSDLLPAFVDLAGEVKHSQVRSVVFRSSEEFAPSNPDYEWVHAKVKAALKRPVAKPDEPTESPSPTPSGTPTANPSEAPAAAVDAKDTCAYQPVS